MTSMMSPVMSLDQREDGGSLRFSTPGVGGTPQQQIDVKNADREYKRREFQMLTREFLGSNEGSADAAAIINNKSSMPAAPGAKPGGDLVTHVSSQQKRERQRSDQDPKAQVRGSLGCDFCTESFRYKSRLLYHLHMEHADKTFFPCTSCESAFKRPSELRKHIACVHAKYKPFRCQECPSGFYFRKDLRKHFLTVHEKSGKRLCGSCGVQYSGREEHQTHSLGLCALGGNTAAPASAAPRES